MKDKRANDRRKTAKKVTTNRRKGPRRLVCNCGGKIEVNIAANGKETFTCLRCSKNV